MLDPPNAVPQVHEHLQRTFAEHSLLTLVFVRQPFRDQLLHVVWVCRQEGVAKMTVAQALTVVTVAREHQVEIVFAKISVQVF